MTQDRRQRGKRYEGGRRKKDAVAYRTLITLDADNIRVPLPEYQAHLEKALQGLQAAVYTTHSSTKERPRVRPTSRPDTDNYIKIAMDGLNKALFKDDSYVVSIRAEKHYSDTPRMEIIVSQLTLGDVDHD